MATPYHSNTAAPQAPTQNYFEDFEKVPSVSFATAPVGTVVKGVISRMPTLVHDRDIATKEPKYWKSGEPQMSVVIHMDITTAQGVVETRSVWVKKPSSMYRALGQAQKDAGQPFALGGTLFIRYERSEPSKTPGFHPQKIYVAKYEPPVAADPWGNTATPAQTRQQPAALDPATLCQYPALPQGPRLPQGNGLCGNVQVGVLAGYRVCALHKAQAESAAQQAPAAAPTPQPQQWTAPQPGAPAAAPQPQPATPGKPGW